MSFYETEETKKVEGATYVDPKLVAMAELYKQLRARDDLEIYKASHPELNLTRRQEVDVVYDFVEKIEAMILEEWEDIMAETVREVQMKERGGIRYGAGAL